MIADFDFMCTETYHPPQIMRFIWLTSLTVALGANCVLADVIRLPQGGQLRGEFAAAVKVDDAAPATIETLDGIRITVAPEDVVYSKERSRVLEEYYSHARDADGSVEAAWQLADWCRTMRLYPQRDEQLQHILALDSEHAEARRILGYQNYNGNWMTRDEFMESQGYVQLKGKWMTPQERDLREKSDAQRKAEAVWFPKVRLWVGWLGSPDFKRQQSALAEFQQLTDPDAISAMRTTMETHRDFRIRKLYVEVLTNLPGDAGVSGLVGRLLFDDHLEVRMLAQRGLPPSRHSAALPQLVKALQSTNNDVVNRAAAMLGETNSSEVVPSLIQALVTTHKYRSEVAVNTGVSFGQSGGGNVQFNPGQGVLPPDVAIAAQTGQLPYGVNVQRQGYQRMQPITVRVDVPNAEVLMALRKLTGKDFGYRERDWQLWWALQKV